MIRQHLKPGQQLTATELNELTSRVEQQGRASGSGSLAVNNVGGALVYRDVSVEPLLGRITGAGSGAKYPWIEVVRNADGTTTDATEFPSRFGTATVQPAVELGGRTDVPVNAIVELAFFEGGTGWGFVYGVATAINTQNVDGTAADATTTDIRADQTTHIKFAPIAGPPSYQKLLIDLAALGNDTTLITNLISSGALFTFTVPVDVVTCVDFTNQKVLKRTITMLTGTLVSDPFCVNNAKCCPEVSVSCCPGHTIPQILTLTVGGGGGDFPATFDGVNTWDTGEISPAGCGTFRVQLSCGGGGWAVAGNFVGLDCAFALDLHGLAVTCSPFLATAVGAFGGGSCACNGAKTLTWAP